ncbi:hypothetical protein B0H11DRAFT_227498 [Mycena galericulata]|nr:hypothetical protein B0H11DRAFT_227498 [Mycena galericulata]
MKTDRKRKKVVSANSVMALLGIIFSTTMCSSWDTYTDVCVPRPGLYPIGLFWHPRTVHRDRARNDAGRSDAHAARPPASTHIATRRPVRCLRPWLRRRRLPHWSPHAHQRHNAHHRDACHGGARRRYRLQHQPPRDRGGERAGSGRAGALACVRPQRGPRGSVSPARKPARHTCVRLPRPEAARTQDGARDSDDSVQERGRSVLPQVIPVDGGDSGTGKSELGIANLTE